MNLHELNKAIHKKILDDDRLTALNECRYAMDQIKLLVKLADPNSNIRFLAYPKAQSGEKVHYAAIIQTEDGVLLANPVAAPGFPQYIGPVDEAPGLFSEMVETDHIVG